MEMNSPALIVSEEMSDIPGVEQHFLFEERLIGIVPASVPVEQRRPELLASKLAFARFMRGHSRHQIVEQYLAGIGLDPSHDIECSSPAPILELVNLGTAWTITTPFSVGYLRPALDKIVWMALPEPVSSRKIYLLAHAGRYLDLPQRLADRCRKALLATLDGWRQQTGNDVLVNAVRVAKPSVKAAPSASLAARHGRAIT
jgi:DNA-binding transcriptional LysR family regulator